MQISKKVLAFGIITFIPFKGGMFRSRANEKGTVQKYVVASPKDEGELNLSVIAHLVSLLRQLRVHIRLLAEFQGEFDGVQFSVQKQRHVVICLKVGPFFV